MAAAAPKVAGKFVKKFMKKTAQATVAGYAGYELGKEFGQSEIVFRPNITVTLPKCDGEANSISSNNVIIVLLAIIVVLILLIAGNYIVSKLIKKLINRANVRERQGQFIDLQVIPNQQSIAPQVQSIGQIHGNIH